MQLQYVFGNPRPKITRKKKKKVLTRTKSSKIKTKGNPMAKKKKKARSAAQKAAFRKMRAGLAAWKKSKRNPRKSKRVKKKRNPGYYTSKKPVYKTRKSKVFPLASEIDEARPGVAAQLAGARALADKINGMSTDEMLKLNLMGRLKKMINMMNRQEKLAAKDQKALDALEKRYFKALEWKEKEEADGGRIEEHLIGYKKNPRRKKMAKRRKKRKAKKNPTVRMKAHSNPKKKKSSKKRRKSKKSKGSLVRFTGSTRLSKKAIQRFKRRRRLNVSVKINPLDRETFISIGKVVGIGALGLVATNLLLIPVIDFAVQKVTGKSLTGVIAANKYAAPVAGALGAATVGFVASYAIERWSNKIPLGDKIVKAAPALRMASGVMGILAASYFITKAAQPYTSKALAKLGIQTAPMAGVMYFPGMAGADFGMYPQMGDGYKQQPGDFGLIPNGLQGVKYFPNSGMGSVDYFPEGSNGDDMYRQGETGDLLEAEGLGSPDFGEIPQGMGEVPEGMGEGQLG